MRDTASLRSWLLLRTIRGIGDTTYFRLIQAFGSPETILRASRGDLMSVGEIGSSLAESIRLGPDDDAKRGVDAELKKLEALGISVIPLSDPDYPSRLNTIPDPPPL